MLSVKVTHGITRVDVDIDIDIPVLGIAVIVVVEAVVFFLL